MVSFFSECGCIHCCKKEFHSKVDNRMADCVDPDERLIMSSLIWICTFCSISELVCRDERINSFEVTDPGPRGHHRENIPI